MTAKLLQYFLRCLEKKKDADAGLRIELEKSLRRLLAFVFVRDKAAELIPWKEFVKTKNVVTGVVIPMVKVRKLCVRACACVYVRMCLLLLPSAWLLYVK